MRYFYNLSNLDVDIVHTKDCTSKLSRFDITVGRDLKGEGYSRLSHMSDSKSVEVLSDILTHCFNQNTVVEYRLVFEADCDGDL